MLFVNILFTVSQRSCGKVMFSFVSFCSQGGPMWPYDTLTIQGFTPGPAPQKWSNLFNMDLTVQHPTLWTCSNLFTTSPGLSASGRLAFDRNAFLLKIYILKFTFLVDFLWYIHGFQMKFNQLQLALVNSDLKLSGCFSMESQKFTNWVTIGFMSKTSRLNFMSCGRQLDQTEKYFKSISWR